LIFRKIIKIVATRGQILTLKCTKFDFGWDSAPDPAGGAYIALPDSLAGCKGPISRRGEGRGEERRGRKENEREGTKREGREREGRKCTVPPPTFE